MTNEKLKSIWNSYRSKSSKSCIHTKHVLLNCCHQAIFFNACAITNPCTFSNTYNDIPSFIKKRHLHMLIYTSYNTTNTIQLKVEYNVISIYNNFEEVESMVIFFELNLLRPTIPTNVFKLYNWNVFENWCQFSPSLVIPSMKHLGL